MPTLAEYQDRDLDGMTLKEALRVIYEEEHLDDFIYQVRERAASDPDFKGNTWEHPRVKQFSQACVVIRRELYG